MKRILIFMLVLLMAMSFYVQVYAQTYDEDISAESALLIDAGTGEVLYAKNETQKVYPVGTTKLMTALVAYELCSNLDETVEIVAEALDDVSVENDKTLSPMLSVGEKLTMRDIIGGVLVGSGNDAAVVAAYFSAGSIDAFVTKMNEKAVQLGMSDTHFTNPHGRSGEEHYTTAADMCKLMSEVYTQPELVEILESSVYNIAESESTVGREITSCNLFFSDDTQRYENGRGSLGGYTYSAGGGLVACAEKNGTRLICAVFGEDTVDGTWKIARSLFEFAFNMTVEYTAEEIFKDIQLTAEKMTIIPDFTGITVEVSKYLDLDGITVVVEEPDDNKSDVGYAKYYAKDGTFLASVPLSFVKNGPSLILKILKILLVVVIAVVALAVLTVIVLRVLNIRKARERARRRDEREALRAKRIEEESKPVDFSEFQE